jgi:trans-2,3-dihydro-3-hydroxyanthranilate isomerase
MTSLPLGGESLDYAVVDVFVGDPAQPFEGNPLAVVFGADDLTTAQCQALAVEFNLSETVFPMAPTEAGMAGGADYRARIFTIASELPFAGHPSVGVAWALARLGRLAPGVAVQECPVGLVTLEIPPGIATDGNGLVRLTGPVPEVSEPVDPQPLLDAVSLQPSDLAGPPPRLSGTGLRFAYLNVRPDAVARAHPNLAALAALDSSVMGVQVLALPEGGAPSMDETPSNETSADRPLDVHARVIVGDIGEDPATGSAAIALSGWLIASNIAAADGDTHYTIRQGIEMGRPSVLACDVAANNGVIERVRVSGRVAAVASGCIRIP